MSTRIARARMLAATAVLSLVGILAAGCESTPTATASGPSTPAVAVTSTADGKAPTYLPPGEGQMRSAGSASRSARAQIAAVNTVVDALFNDPNTSQPAMEQDTLVFDQVCQVAIVNG